MQSIKFYPSQIETQKKQLAIDTVAMLVYIVQEKWSKKASKWFIYGSKKTFDHISKSQLLKHIIDLSIDRNLVV